MSCIVASTHPLDVYVCGVGTVCDNVIALADHGENRDSEYIFRNYIVKIMGKRERKMMLKNVKVKTYQSEKFLFLFRCRYGAPKSIEKYSFGWESCIVQSHPVQP